MVITAILNVFVRKEIRRWCGVLNKDLCIGQKKHFSISTDLCQCLSRNQNVKVKAKYYVYMFGAVAFLPALSVAGDPFYTFSNCLKLQV